MPLGASFQESSFSYRAVWQRRGVVKTETEIERRSAAALTMENSIKTASPASFLQHLAISYLCTASSTHSQGTLGRTSKGVMKLIYVIVD